MGYKLEDLPPKFQEQAKKQWEDYLGISGNAPSGKLTDLSMLFDARMKQLAPELPPPVCEFPFDRTGGRKFRFDRAWPDQMVAVELDGGVWSGGRHVRPRGFTEDCFKMNLAALQGWTVLRFTTEMLVRDPQQCLRVLASVLSGRPARGR